MPTSPEKIESLLGFAVRAGKVLFGFDALVAPKRAHVHLVLYGPDLAENTKTKLDRLCAERKIPRLLCKKTLEEMLRRSGVKAVGITDKQMARAMVRYANENFIWIAPEVD